MATSFLMVVSLSLKEFPIAWRDIDFDVDAAAMVQ
jgi:hypothetical protein